MGDLTKFLSDNKTEIKAFGESVARFFGVIEDGADLAFKAIKTVVDLLKELKISQEQMAKIDLNKTITKIDPAIYQQNLNYYNNLANPAYFAPMLKTLDDVKTQTKGKVEAINKEIEKVGQVEPAKMIGGGGISAAIERTSEKFDENLEAAKENVKKQRVLSDELYKITHDEYENKKMDLLNWRQELLNNEETNAEQRILIEKIYAEKSKQIEQERQQKINGIREEIASKNRTDLENQIADIEKSKQRRIEAGLPAIEAEKAAEQEKFTAIKNLEEEFSETLDSIHQTEHEKRLAQIEKEKEAWIRKGIDEVKATELAEQQKAEAAKNAALNILKSQLRDYRAFRDGGYEALQSRMLAALRKQGISDLDLKINDTQLTSFLQAQKEIQNNFLPNIQGFTSDINNSLNEMAENVKNVNPSLDEAKNNLSEIIEPLAEFKTNLSDMAPPIEDIKENFAGLSEKVITLPDLFDTLGNSISNLIDLIYDVPEINFANDRKSEDFNKTELPEIPPIDNSALLAAINQSNQNISETQNYIDGAQNKISEVINSLSEMTTSINGTRDLLSQVKSVLDKVAEIKVSTPTVNITQNVNEPHAWDNGLIQELADKVADKMKNEIIYAIKGSYGY